MRRQIGKGLSQLIGEQFDNNGTEIALDAISPNARQPRRVFDPAALAELSASIKEHGILQPIVVRPVADGKYELIAGERRWRAAKLAGLKTVPATVRAATNEVSLELALIENIQREDINSMECARAYRLLIDEFGLTQEKVAERVGKSRVVITNTLRLLKLPQRIQDALQNEQITEGHARALLGFDNEIHMLAVFEEVAAGKLTVRDVETRAKTYTKPKKQHARPKADSSQSDPNDAALAEALSTYFGTPVKLHRGEIHGELSIQFYSDDDLERILDILGFRI